MQRGFTLLELLVVLAIIGVLSGALGFGFGSLGHDQAEQALRDLAHRYRYAQEQAIVTGTEYGWQTDGFRFRFSRYLAGSWRYLDSDPLLPSGSIQGSFPILVTRGGLTEPLVPLGEQPRPQLVFPADGFVDPYSVELRDREGRMWDLRNPGGIPRVSQRAGA